MLHIRETKQPLTKRMAQQSRNHTKSHKHSDSIWRVTFAQFKQACSSFLLLHINIIYYQSLKILSYILYNNSTDETQAASRHVSARNRRATFSLYTIIVMKLKNDEGMQRLDHWGWRDCFKRMQSLHRRLYKKTGTNISKEKTFKCCFIKGMSCL